MKSFVVGTLLAVGVAVFAAGAGAKNPNGDQPSPIARGPHISGVARYQPKPSATPSAAAAASCSTPGSGNYRTDCNSSGRPVNETSVTYGSNGTGSQDFYAGANDYNSYNGQGQDGFYWSSDGVNWQDAGPIDVFPHNNNNGAGDPGLAVDSSGVVYYSSLFFNFYRCNVGGVELLRRDTSGNWSYYQIASNSQNSFQDKPAITLSGSNVYVSWTQFSSCSGSGTSPIRVAALPQGPSSVAPTTTLANVPGSSYSQGSSIASDGNGGFWIAWEEFPSATATNGEIRLAHYSGSGWVPVYSNGPLWETISPSGFRDLPNPLPGFKFRDNSFPALTVTNGNPEVVWTSYDSGAGRAYLWNQGTVTPVSSSGGDQFFPSIAPDGSGGVYVAYSQANSGTSTSTYDQWLWHGSNPTKVSTASSNPSNDAFFSGQFIGDYNGMVFDGTTAHPIWTDIRGSDPNYSGWEMDSMIASTGSAPSPSPGFTLSATSASVTAGGSTTSTVTVTPQNGYMGTVQLNLSGAPTGVTSAGTSANVSSSSSVQVELPISTTPSTAAGTYTLTITGTSSNPSASSSTTMSLTVNPASGSTKPMTVSVASSPSTQKGHNYIVPLTVTVEDSSTATLTPISGATVALNVYSDASSATNPACTTLGSLAASGSGTTGSNGTVGFNFRTKATGSWCAVATASDTGYTTTKSDPAPFTTPNP